jgi:hypothetical protein
VRDVAGIGGVVPGAEVEGPVDEADLRPARAQHHMLDDAGHVRVGDALLVAITALTEGHGFAGWSRPIGVAVGGVLAWRKAPLVVVLLAAAATDALLRLVFR